MTEDGAENPTESPKQADGRSPLRRCLATGETLPKERMVRFVVGPDGSVVPDVEGKLPGRGLWVAADRSALDRAVRKGLFSRAARTTARPPEDLADRVDALLTARCLALLGLARGAGQAVAGYEKVRAWLKQGQAAVLVAASDGAEDGRAKLRALAPALPVVALFPANRLGICFGRDHAVHVAVAPGGLARAFLGEAARLQGLRAGPGGAA